MSTKEDERLMWIGISVLIVFSLVAAYGVLFDKSKAISQ